MQAVAATSKNGYAVYHLMIDGSRTDLSFDRKGGRGDSGYEV